MKSRSFFSCCANKRTKTKLCVCHFPHSTFYGYRRHGSYGLLAHKLLYSTNDCMINFTLTRSKQMQKNKPTSHHVCPTSKWIFKMMYIAKLLKQIVSFGCHVIQSWHISTDVSEFLLPPALGWKNNLNGQRTTVL